MSNKVKVTVVPLLPFMVLVLVLAFWGDPDLTDAAVHYLMSCR